MTQPPSTAMSWPVIWRDASLAKRFARVRAGLDAALVGPDAIAVEQLEQRWPDLLRAAFHDDSDYGALLAGLPPDDPVRAPVGLLELLGRARRETLHTAAIAGLVDPSTEGGLARLRRFLEVALAKTGREVPDGLEKARVLVERAYSVSVGSATSNRPGANVISRAPPEPPVRRAAASAAIIAAGSTESNAISISRGRDPARAAAILAARSTATV